MKYQGRPHFDQKQQPRIGVLLCNLGTPAEPTPKAVKSYLKEFLSDPRVVELPRSLWLPVLHGVILNTRPAKSAHLYKKIWTKEGSPLACYTEKQCALLRQTLEKTFGENKLTTAYAMRYGAPDIKSGINQLLKSGAEKIVVLPLYPQYASSTTGSTYDALSKVFHDMRWVPELHFISDYHDKPAYISACATQIRKHWQLNPRSDKLLFSFHGLPQAQIDNGDPYFNQCQKTAHLLAEELDLQQQDYLVCFQSRLGLQEWVKPYTDQVLNQLPAQSISSVDVFCPGFAADCLETLEEIALQNKQIFLDASGTSFQYIAALNDSPEHIEALAGIVSPIINEWLK